MSESAASRLGQLQDHLSPKPADKLIQDVYIISAMRTPTGKYNGVLKSVSAPELGAAAIKAALAKTTVPVEAISDVIMGNVLQAGLGQAPARQAMVLAGLPTTTIDAVTVNKVCSSGLKAVVLAAQNIQLGLAQAQIAGGMESMSSAPFYVARGGTAGGVGNRVLEDGLIKDGLWDVYGQMHMGRCAEHTAKQYGITRGQQDAYAIRSFHRAQAAWAAHRFDEEITPVTIQPRGGSSSKRAAAAAAAVVVAEDEGYRSLVEAKVPVLTPAFVKDGTGTVTAANASTMNDGASAVVLVSASLARQHAQGSRVLSRIVASADAAVEPIDYCLAPAKAIALALRRAGLSTADVARWEINEAFAVVVRVTEQLLGLDDASAPINLDGGAISLGHALGSSGARLLTTLVHGLEVGQYGVAALCNGGGGSTCVVVQRVDCVP